MYIERAKQISVERMMAWKETIKSLPQNHERKQKKSLPKKKTSGSARQLTTGEPRGKEGGKGDGKGGRGRGRGVKTGPVISAVNSLAAQNLLLPQVKPRHSLQHTLDLVTPGHDHHQTGDFTPIQSA